MYKKKNVEKTLTDPETKRQATSNERQADQPFGFTPGPIQKAVTIASTVQLASQVANPVKATLPYIVADGFQSINNEPNQRVSSTGVVESQNQRVAQRSFTGTDVSGRDATPADQSTPWNLPSDSAQRVHRPNRPEFNTIQQGSDVVTDSEGKLITAQRFMEAQPAPDSLSRSDEIESTILMMEQSAAKPGAAGISTIPMSNEGIVQRETYSAETLNATGAIGNYPVSKYGLTETSKTNEQESATQKIDTDELARLVYGQLKRRLALERERLHFH